MNKRYPELDSEDEIKEHLDEMGVDIFEPVTRSQELIAQVMEEFASFVLEDHKERCLEILENDINNNWGSVGELQGGSDDFSIYRVSFPVDIPAPTVNGQYDTKKCKNNAALLLLNEFNSYSKNTRNSNIILTAEQLKQYLLGMCDRRSMKRYERNYTSLGNFMFILQFGGPTQGQVRHIDNMVPNLQICLYMSSRCPSTIVYAMGDGDGHGHSGGGENVKMITNGRSLVEHWEQSYDDITIPCVIRDILYNMGNVHLKSKWYTKYFSFWNTIDSHLHCFGKLYQPVSFQLQLISTDPGTTMLAGGNEVHAGPPVNGPRMFAFAVGIPEEAHDDDVCLSSDTDVDGQEDHNDDNHGEVQYSPVLLHIDFCCLLFSILDHVYAAGLEIKSNVCCKASADDNVREAKHFLLVVLMELLKDYPMDGYLRQIDTERGQLLVWIGKVLENLDKQHILNILIDDAINSSEIFYTPDTIKRRFKKKKKNRRNKAKLIEQSVNV